MSKTNIPKKVIAIIEELEMTREETLWDCHGTWVMYHKERADKKPKEKPKEEDPPEDPPVDPPEDPPVDPPKDQEETDPQKISEWEKITENYMKNIDQLPNQGVCMAWFDKNKTVLKNMKTTVPRLFGEIEEHYTKKLNEIKLKN